MPVHLDGCADGLQPNPSWSRWWPCGICDPQANHQRAGDPAGTIAAGGMYHFQVVALEDIYEIRNQLQFPKALNYLLGMSLSALLPFSAAIAQVDGETLAEVAGRVQDHSVSDVYDARVSFAAALKRTMGNPTRTGEVWIPESGGGPEFDVIVALGDREMVLRLPNYASAGKWGEMESKSHKIPMRLSQVHAAEGQ